ncbi:MAG: transketolase, partial [Bacilli bacterium]
MNPNEQKIIDNIRALGIDMIDTAASGHPGIVLGAAPIIYALYAKHLNFSLTDEKWINRDRFILSAGHGSALLYATLFMAGFNLTLDDLKSFRQLHSKTPGHPEYRITPGVDMTTGPLGQGLASAVGMAMAECYLGSKYNPKKKSVFDISKDVFNYYTYVLCSDGDLMEGVSYEAASLAGTLKLGKLIVLYDSNNISLDGSTNKTFTEDVLGR